MARLGSECRIKQNLKDMPKFSSERRRRLFGANEKSILDKPAYLSDSAGCLFIRMFILHSVIILRGSPGRRGWIFAVSAFARGSDFLECVNVPWKFSNFHFQNYLFLQAAKMHMWISESILKSQYVIF